MITRAFGQHLLAKFAPPDKSAAAKRIADLLVAEHLAHEVLRRHGVATAHSRIVRTPHRTFLEIERFDRTPTGRRGLISLLALDAEFIGDLRSWSRSAARLHSEGEDSNLGKWSSQTSHVIRVAGRDNGSVKLRGGCDNESVDSVRRRELQTSQEVSGSLSDDTG